MTLLDPTDFRYADMVSKAKRPIDRDSDGKVYDGTKRERAALPGERMPNVGRRPGGAAGGIKDAGDAGDADKKYIVAYQDRMGNMHAKEFANRKRARDYGIALRNGGQMRNIRAVPSDHPDFPQLKRVAQGDKAAGRGKGVPRQEQPAQRDGNGNQPGGRNTPEGKAKLNRQGGNRREPPRRGAEPMADEPDSGVDEQSLTGHSADYGPETAARRDAGLPDPKAEQVGQAGDRIKAVVDRALGRQGLEAEKRNKLPHVLQGTNEEFGVKVNIRAENRDMADKAMLPLAFRAIQAETGGLNWKIIKPGDEGYELELAEAEIPEKGALDWQPGEMARVRADYGDDLYMQIRDQINLDRRRDEGEVIPEDGKKPDVEEARRKLREMGFDVGPNGTFRGKKPDGAIPVQGAGDAAAQPGRGMGPDGEGGIRVAGAGDAAAKPGERLMEQPDNALGTNTAARNAERDRLRARRAQRDQEMAADEAARNDPANQPHYVVMGRNDVRRYPNKAAAEQNAKGGLIIGPDHKAYEQFMQAKQPNQVQMEGINRARRVAREANMGTDTAMEERRNRAGSEDMRPTDQLDTVGRERRDAFRRRERAAESDDMRATENRARPNHIARARMQGADAAKDPNRRRLVPDRFIGDQELEDAWKEGFEEERLAQRGDARKKAINEWRDLGNLAGAAGMKPEDAPPEVRGDQELNRAWQEGREAGAANKAKAREAGVGGDLPAVAAMQGANPRGEKAEPGMGRAMQIREIGDAGANAYEAGKKQDDFPDEVDGDDRLMEAWREGWRRARDQKAGDQRLAGRAIIGAGGFKQLDLDNNTVEAKKPVPKMQIRQDKVRGGYNVVGVDYKGRRVKVHAKSKDIAENIRAALKHRDLNADDYLNEWEQADKKRRMADDLHQREQRRANARNAGINEYENGGNVDNIPTDIKNDDALREAFVQGYEGAQARDVDRARRGEPLRRKQAKPRERSEGAPQAQAAAARHGGKWDRNQAYQRGDVVQHGNGLWRAKANLGNGEKPGDGMWDLVQEGGQDSWRHLDNMDSRGVPQADAGDAMFNVARQPAPGQPSKQKISPDKLIQAMQRIRGADAGNAKRNAFVKAWAAARVAMAEGNQEGFKAFMDDVFEAEERLGGPDNTEVEDLRQLVEDGLFGDEFDDLMDVAMDNVEGWGADWYPNPMREKWRAARGKAPDKPKADTVAQADAAKENLAKGDNTEAIKAHFAAGGSIADAPIGNVVAVVQSMPERFEMFVNGKKGVSPNWWVVDKQSNTGDEVKIPTPELDERGNPIPGTLRWVKTSNEVWVFKASIGAEDLQQHVRRDFRGRNIDDDVLGEIMGQNIQEQVGIFSASARWGTPANSRSPYVLQRHLSHTSSDRDDKREQPVGFLPPDLFMYRVGKGGEPGQGGDGWKPGSKWYQNLEDPKQMIELGLFDYIIQNGDRHPGNWSGLVMANGKIRIGVYDNGLGFRGHSLDPVGWLRYSGYAKDNARWGIAGFRDRHEARKAIVDIIDKQFANFDVEKAVQRLLDGGADPANLREGRQKLELVAERIRALQANKEKVADMLMGEGR